MICKKWYNGGFDILPQKRDIMQILHDYLHAIQSISESDKEHTHRSALENLFKAILAHLAQSHKDFSTIHIIHEPNNDKSENKAGAPDFQIILNGGGAE